MRTYFKIFVFILITFFVRNLSAETKTVQQIINEAMIKSPLIKAVKANVDVTEQAQKLVKSYHFPVFNFTQSATSSTNPVNVFAAKLMQEDFTMNDFDINALNNPAARMNNRSSFTLYVPLYMGGQISRKQDSLSKQYESMEYQLSWVKKIVRRNVYGIYNAILNMGLMNSFLESEEKYLDHLLSYYDAKSGDNSNRYLSYNKGRIIKESILEAKEEIKLNIKKMVIDLKFVSGIEDLSYESIDLTSLDILSDFNSDLEVSKPLLREDLLSSAYYMESLKLDASSEKSKTLPTIGAFANANFSSKNFDRFGKDYTLGVKLSWDFGLFSFRTASLSESKKESAQYEYEKNKKQIESEVSKLKEDLNLLGSKIASMEKQQTLFEENKKILTSQYRRGSIDLYNLLDNFAHYIENKGNIQKVKTEYKFKQMELFDSYNRS
jgi:outer membrane protein TolC